MGTNFYAKCMITQDEYELVHLGKRSCGWQFIFDHNWGKYYQPNRSSIEDFLDLPDIYIEDEYGAKYEATEFWDIIDEWNILPENYLTSEIYVKLHPEERNDYFSEDIKKCEELFNVVPKYHNFQVNGLTFAIYSDFI